MTNAGPAKQHLEDFVSGRPWIFNAGRAFSLRVSLLMYVIPMVLHLIGFGVMTWFGVIHWGGFIAKFESCLESWVRDLLLIKALSDEGMANLGSAMQCIMRTIYLIKLLFIDCILKFWVVRNCVLLLQIHPLMCRIINNLLQFMDDIYAYNISLCRDSIASHNLTSHIFHLECRNSMFSVILFPFKTVRNNNKGLYLTIRNFDNGTSEG